MKNNLIESRYLSGPIGCLNSDQWWQPYSLSIQICFVVTTNNLLYRYVGCSRMDQVVQNLRGFIRSGPCITTTDEDNYKNWLYLAFPVIYHLNSHLWSGKKGKTNSNYWLSGSNEGGLDTLETKQLGFSCPFLGPPPPPIINLKKKMNCNVHCDIF